MRKTSIITGSATGVGASTAIQLAEEGWNVVVNYSKSEREAEETSQVCRSKGAEVLLFKADVSVDDKCRDMVSAAIEKWGRLDALVNNAGTTRFCPLSNLEGVSEDDFLHLYRVNVLSAFQMSRAAAPHLKKTKGSIVNVSSISALNGSGSSIAYTSSKGALVTLTLSLAHALAPDVRVNCICPGFIQGRWTRNFLKENYDRVNANFAQASSLQVTATPEDIADAIAYYVTRAKINTGEIRTIDGGFSHNVAKLG
ncbi:MAG: SDR family oxidoreductase [Saprospiraceae bacterium]|nr:SDR family oxidoreductase [Saprospiraceae bacterium]